MEAISIHGLTKGYGNFHLSVPELYIKEGYITGLVGRNGAGKTTLLRMILGCIAPDTGEALVYGQNLFDKPELRQQVGYVSETSFYQPNLTAQQVHDTISPFYTGWNEALYQKLMCEFEIPNLLLREFSKGQSKLFSVIMAVCFRPRLLILDEPTANLDPAVRHRLLHLLREFMAQEGQTVLYSTHITSDLEMVCDYLVGVQKGKISFCGEKDKILEQAVLVQGAEALLTEEAQKLFSGWEKTEYGFCGLCRDKNLAEEFFGREAIYRRPTIEELVIYGEGAK